MKARYALVGVAVCLLAVLLACTPALASPSFDQAVDKLIAKGYPQGIEDYLTSLGTSAIGFRMAGTPADNAAAAFIAKKMRQAGLVNVRLEPVSVDVWDFRGASVTVGKRVMPASIFGGSPGTSTDGVTGDVVYVGPGRAEDYAAAGDVSGKIVVVEFRPSWWWMDLCAAEAGLWGAKAVVCMRTPEDPKYWGAAPDALGIFDATYYSLHEPPIVVVSQESGDWLKEKSAPPHTIAATVKSDVRMTFAEDGGVGYNVVGELPGKDRNGQMTVVSAHHDAFFSGALDDTSACACLLTVAKAMRTSGYQPRRSVVFLCTTAEEFGSMRAYYQFCHGSWEAITQQHPDWAGRITAMLNLEMQGARDGRLNMKMNPELQPWIADSVAEWADLLPSGTSIVTPVHPWNDQFAFTAAGVPSIEFATKTADYESMQYHTQYDTKALIDWSYLGQNAKFYYRLATQLDRGLLPYSLTARADDVDAAIDEAELLWAQADPNVVSRLSDDIAAFKEAAAAFDESSSSLTGARVKSANRTLLDIEKTINSSFTALSVWDATIYPHQQVLWDVESLSATIEALQGDEPDVEAALNALAWVGMTWYGLNFSYEVYLEELAWHAPDFPYLYWGAQAHLAPYLDIMPQWGLILEGSFGQASEELAAMRDAELTELNVRLTDMCQVLETVTRQTEGLL